MTMRLFDLDGPIPASFVNLTRLQKVDFFNNTLQGPVPVLFSEMPDLFYLDLGYNDFVGTVPIEYNTLGKMRNLSLNQNHLIGTLPTLAASTNLFGLFISENQLSGTILDSYANFKGLSILRVGDNLLNGTIPAFLGNLVNLTALGLYRNAFTGALPDLSRLNNLASLAVAVNQLHGTVPSYFGRMPRLVQLLLTSNHFTGPIPAELCESKSLVQLYLNINDLTGSLPVQLGSVRSLRALRVDDNQLTGPIPASIVNATNLAILNFASNELTGALPSAMGQLKLLQQFDASYNSLTGTIPASTSELRVMQNFSVASCYLSGPIPEEIGHMTALQYLALFDNFLTSTLPATLKHAQNLIVLLLHNNRLSGSLLGVFNASLQTRVSTVQLSENGFTGDLPVELFALPQLETAILGTNCFQGKLPAAMCNASSLQTLSLNGLRSGAPCRKSLFPLISKAYTLTHPIQNGIPTCLFEMASLNTLQISGSGMTSTLPSEIKIGTNLIALALSHNKLTGTIPHVFQHRIWYNLDLSSNKLQGTLCEDFATVAPELTNSTLLRFSFRFNSTNIEERYRTTAALSLSDNRLSYKVPNILEEMENISVLTGNLFGCELDHSDLPEHDSGRYAYNCGSNSFNASYTAYMCCVGLALIIISGLYYWRERFLSYMDILELKRTVNKWISFSHLYRDSSGQAIMRRYESVLLMADELCKIGAYCTAYIIVLQLPVYCSFDAFYGTHTYEYAWSASAAFLSGDAAASFLIASFAVLLVMVLYLVKRVMEKMGRVYAEAKRHDSIQSIEVIPDDHEGATSMKKVAIFATYLTVNITIVSLVHVGYVIAIMSATSFYKTLAQLALSAFRLMWSTYGSQYLIRGVQSRLARSDAEVWKTKDAWFFALQLLVQMLNTVVIPCLVVLAISPDCFHYAFVSAADVRSSYFYDDCHIYGTKFGCIAPDYRVATTTFSAPFTYSYECSASWITFYAPALVYTGLFTTFVNPILDIFKRYIVVQVPRESKWFWLVDKVVPKILRPVNADTVQYDKVYNPLRPYFDANFLLLTVTSYLGLLLTFGFVFPPLAFVLLLAMYSTVYTSRLHVGRFLSEAVADNLYQYTTIIEKECLGISWRFLRGVRVIIAVMAGFYALFVFDTLGDKHGAKKSAAVVTVIFAMPLFFWACVSAYDWYQARYHPDSRHRSYSVGDFGGTAAAMRKMFGGIELGDVTNEASPDRNVHTVNPIAVNRPPPDHSTVERNAILDEVDLNSR
jgi:Leucine-rich repeat (LRR) protein